MGSFLRFQARPQLSNKESGALVWPKRNFDERFKGLEYGMASLVLKFTL